MLDADKKLDVKTKKTGIPAFFLKQMHSANKPRVVCRMLSRKKGKITVYSISILLAPFAFSSLGSTMVRMPSLYEALTASFLMF